MSPAPVNRTHNIQRAICVHCSQKILRFTDIGMRQWLHDPERGFRVRRCQGKDTQAEPAGDVIDDVIG
jgi:hypothetical protein